MDSIKVYQKLNKIKPTRFRLKKPFNRASNARFIFNLRDQELQYYRNFGVYITDQAIEEIIHKKGGFDSSGNQKISVILN